MSEVLDEQTISVLTPDLDTMHAAIDTMLTRSLDPDDDDAVLAAIIETERVRRRLAALDARLITHLERRGVAHAKGHRSTATLLVSALRVSGAEATSRVRLAGEVSPRLSLLGEVLPPHFPEVAAAQESGVISSDHARIVTSTINQLPGHVSADEVEGIEDALLTLARLRGPEIVGKDARRALVLAEVEAAPPEADERRRERRGLTLHPRPDGSARLSGELTAELAETLQTILDPLAAPKPMADGVRDPRTAAQRHHDGLLDALQRLLRCGDVPDSGGVTTTVTIIIDHDAWISGCGMATTGHGGIIPASEAIRWAGGDARVVLVALEKMGAVTALSGEQRLFTPQQRRAMTARDRGCTFPGCTAPPGWCEAHHVTDYAVTRRTSIDDGALACGYHHREAFRQGWTTTMIGGRPYWVPPRWIDPTQTPVRNTVHDLD
ncbi:MAG: DUF222 domain-containing protein [Jatrophihabitans sp.]|uniref:HNH endonuclease signature motif containing protein n=1 Tax=Jatrophihabitans sp. TaxID=1932789 RepID=UPI003F7F451B